MQGFSNLVFAMAQICSEIFQHWHAVEIRPSSVPTKEKKKKESVIPAWDNGMDNER